MLIPSVILCALVTGFIFTYAIVVMPGFSKLSDKEFIKAFQVTDEVIQNNQPLFMITWIGSIISILLTIIVATATTGLSNSWLIILVGVIYLLGVQGVTIVIHLPLNNHIQKMDIDKMTDKNLGEERRKFQKKWNFFNNIRTSVAFLVSVTLILILTMR
tara:strand:- start:101 stop:577 length:477 start_codon:yes stop_codon:yes gene_type:complete